MTQLSDVVYFAPEIKFSELDFMGTQLPDQYHNRIKGLYLDPAALLIDNKCAFSSGLLMVCCIDAVAKYQLLDIDGKEYGVGERFKTWCQKNLPGFNKDWYAECFYKHFRNGLVHESRIKEGGSFSFDIDTTIKENQLSIDIQPLFLHREVDRAMVMFIEDLKHNKNNLALFSQVIQNEFKQELK